MPSHRDSAPADAAEAAGSRDPGGPRRTTRSRRRRPGHADRSRPPARADGRDWQDDLDLDAELPTPDPRGPRWWPVLVPVAVVAVLVSLLLPAGRHQWALSLIRQPTPYTSLFFTKPAALPAAVSWDAPVPVSFSIQNNQGRPTAYRYVITDSAANQTQQLAEATRTVRSGATWTVSIVLHPDCAATPCRFDIALPGHPETIDFQVSMK